MEKYIWRLLTSIFLLLVTIVLVMVAFLFQGVTIIMGIGFYGALLCGLIGVTKGILVIIDYHREFGDKE